jgi:putative membrane protein
MMQDYMYGPHHGYGWYGYGWVYALLGVIALVVILYLVLRDQRAQEKGDRALEILKERYAKGEITKEEFEEMRKNLEK